jgi:AraC-like DNA-binding protein
MEIRRAIPHPKFRNIVRLFEERRVDLGSMTVNWPVSARPHQIIDIYLEEPFRVRVGGGSARRVPETVVVGPQTFPRAQLSMSGKIHVFNILFQPAGLNQLIGVDMRSLVNQDPAASDVLGTSAVRLGDKVRAAPDFSARVRATQQWLDGQMERQVSPNGAVNHASALLITTAGQTRVDDLLRLTGMSASQLQRRFNEQVGLSPKGYARLIRFDQALVARRSAPERSWSDILHDLGYYDQAHFIREFHMFAGISPTRFSGDWENIFFPGTD